MALSVPRTLMSLVLALALLIGGAVHGAMASEMANPMDGPAVSHIGDDGGCQHCDSTDGTMSAADCAVSCVNQVGVVGSVILADDLGDSAAPVLPFGARTGLAAPPEPSPPKHHLG